MASLKANIRTAAAAYSGLTSLLGTTPSTFRWFDERKPQGAGIPCVVVTIVSGSPTYVVTGRLPTGWSRVSFTIWGSTPGSSNASAVESQLLSFLDQLNLIGIPGLCQYPSNVVLQRDAMYTQSEPPIYQRIVDAMVFNNDSL